MEQETESPILFKQCETILTSVSGKKKPINLRLWLNEQKNLTFWIH